MNESETIPGKEKKRSAMKKIFFFIGLVILLGVIIQVMADAYVDTIPKKKYHDAGLIPIEIPAVQLEKEFEGNSEDATVKYKEKLLIVEGRIQKIDKYHSGESFIIFEPAKQKNPILIECLFIRGNDALKNLKNGQDIKVKGYLEFKSDKVVLTESKIVS